MNIHEYQSKAILRSYGVNVPEGQPAFSVDEAVQKAEELGTGVVVVKAQIHAGGRGKAGGVKITHSPAEVRAAAQELLGKILVTHQTGPEGKQVNRLLIEAGSNIAKEYYLSFVIDRQTARIVMMGSEEGGMEIEKVAAEMPDKILKEYIDPAVGLLPFQASRMAYGMHFPQETIRKVTKFMMGLYQVFVSKDCSLAEINPLVVTKEGDVIALDAKLNFDDSALYRHPDIEALRDESEEDPKERRAAKAGLNYVNLGGDVACMVNGAGLAMATVDIIKFYGGEPANFLDVGGDSTPEKIAEAFRIMLDGGQAKGIFVNIFGGINKCDLVAQGIVDAAKLISPDGRSLPVPVVVRLEGTNVERGRQILRDTPIENVIMAPTMEGGAETIVRLVNEAGAKA
ncbi:ADP-forming succinate--CoA ligase subunit beta [Mitsuokella sp.]|uniref:ADP-forming succinate--CoA ligase subunit beta n=1 Tax=Mitsuokella TaxID=52225 RepID=UPI0029E0A1D0|nr:ADP-forming succinate--CoA ligase subunit beta [Mitsuokella sp.]MDD6382338.1 ADP-forming succinate--CoA ligase subunit beta [Selenomonadaceae bacterium]MDY4475721.1 ADP-forming succinate--CoA ligase subunit beta [Mitsuokella sp.]